MPKINFSDINLIILDLDGPINDLTKGKIWAIKSLCKVLKIKLSQKILLTIINYIDQIYETKRIVDYKKILKFVISRLNSRKMIKINSEQKKYFIKNFPSFLAQKNYLNEDLLNIIKKIKQKYNKIKICLYSSQSEKHIGQFFKKSKVNTNLFDKIYSTRNSDEPKPSTKNLEGICKDLKTVPSRTVMIGDNVIVDLMPAKFIGIKTILYSKLVDYCAKNSQDLRQIFKKI